MVYSLRHIDNVIILIIIIRCMYQRILYRIVSAQSTLFPMHFVIKRKTKEKKTITFIVMDVIYYTIIPNALY